MDPVTLGVLGGMAAAGALMQWYNAEQARGAAKEELARIEKMFNDLVPPQYDVKIYDDPQVLQGIQSPVFNNEAITPEVYKQVEKFQPQAAPYIQEIKPEVVKASKEAQTGREAQMDVLKRYQDIVRQGGFDPSMMDQYNLAAKQAQQAAQSRSASILQDAARRGQAGAGSALAAQLQGSSDVMEQNALQSADMAKQAYMNQLQAMRESASLGGNIRQSEMGEAAKNADIINSFNQRASARYQDWLNQQADLANRASIQNIQASQDISNRNVGAQNAATLEGVQRANANKLTSYNVDRQKLLDRIANTEAKNQLRQQDFTNRYNIATGRAGQAQQALNTNMQFAKDRANMIQGATEAGTGIYTTGMKEGLANKEGRAKYGSAWDNPQASNTPVYQGQEYQGIDYTNPDEKEMYA